jgi:FkbM family methyltransferase
MYINADFRTNGEYDFYTSIKNSIHTIFDIGCKKESLFTDFEGNVHYFDPVKSFIDQLKNQPNKNSNAFFNVFGLGDNFELSYYYPRYESFFNRIISCKDDDTNNRQILKLMRGDEYMSKNNIQTIDFLKIDTEGYEFKVLKGFGDKIRNINIIQFEYGGTFLDNNTKLIEVIDYLKSYNFINFSYLTNEGLVDITDYTDHYNYCNIVCFNQLNYDNIKKLVYK